MKPTTVVTTAVLTVAIVCGTGCGTKGSSAASVSTAPSGSSAAANDYSKPALTDEKMTKFIASMKEEHNPLEFVFKPGGMRNLAELKVKEVEFNAYAHKYGFKDYTEYMDTWGRVMVGEIQASGAKMMKGLAESTQKSIAEAEEKLKKPDLSADERKMYTEQLESGRKSLADLQKPDKDGLNAADLALVEKYSAQIDEAAKKYRKQS